MTRTLNERSGLPGSIEDDRRPDPTDFLSAYPGYRSTALLARLRTTAYSYLAAGGTFTSTTPVRACRRRGGSARIPSE